MMTRLSNFGGLAVPLLLAASLSGCSESHDPRMRVNEDAGRGDGSSSGMHPAGGGSADAGGRPGPGAHVEDGGATPTRDADATDAGDAPSADAVMGDAGATDAAAADGSGPDGSEQGGDAGLDGSLDAEPPVTVEALAPGWQLDCQALPSDGLCEPGPNEVLLVMHQSGRVAMLDSADGHFLGYLPAVHEVATYGTEYVAATQGPDACLWITREQSPVQRWDTDGRVVDTILPLDTYYVDVDGRSRDAVANARSVSFTSDAVYVATGNVLRAGLDGAFQELIVLDDRAEAADVMPLGDGRLVIADAGGWSTFVLDLESGERTTLWTGVISEQLAHAGDGKVLVANRNLSEPVGLVDLATGERTEVKPGVNTSGNAHGIGLLDDGRWVVTGSVTPLGIGLLDPDGVPKGALEDVLDDPADPRPVSYRRIGRACVPDAVLEAARPPELGSACPPPPTTEALYEADFESPDLDAIADPGGLASIDGVGADGSHSSLRIQSGADDPSQGVRLPIAEVSPSYARFDIRVSETAASNPQGEAVASGIVLFRSGELSEAGTLEGFYFSRGELRSSNSRVRIPTDDGTWRRVELSNIDWDAHTYDLCVDGTLRASGVALSDQTHLATLVLSNRTEGAQLWIDNVVLK